MNDEPNEAKTMTMDLQRKLDEWQNKSRAELVEGERMLTHKLGSRLAVLSGYGSTPKLLRSKIFAGLRDEIDRLAFGYEFGAYAPTGVLTKPFWRAVSWDLHHGLSFEGILEVIKTHPIISKADVICLTSVDLGLARSGNRNVARSLAIETECNYVFASHYLHFGPQNFAKADIVGLEGVVVLSRLPLSRPRVVALENGKDPMCDTRKRYGSPKALLVDVDFVGVPLTLGCVSFDVLSSPKHRGVQMEHLLSSVRAEPGALPTLIGGAFNTSTYDASSVWGLAAGLANKASRGVDYILDEHHTYPERHFETAVFHSLKKHGFSWEALNEMGRGTFHMSGEELAASAALNPVLPSWMVKSARRLLRSHGDKISLKLDWFAASERVISSSHPQAEKPKVVGQLSDANGRLSTHDPIVLDFEIIS